MRALLLFNPAATTTHVRLRDALAATLASELKLEVHATQRRGHAADLAAAGVRDGFEVVVALGGDGTVNEVVQGLAGSGVPLAIVPGGSTNVIARSLGVSRRPRAAATALLERLRRGECRTINLGQCNGRYFTFAAGFGFDAAVVRSVERHPEFKRNAGQLAFLYCAFQTFWAGYDRSRLTIRATVAGTPMGRAYGVAMVCNTSPYTYLGPRPFPVAPFARFDRDLDLVAVRTLRTASILRIVGQVFTTQAHVGNPQVDHVHDQPEIALTSPVPLPVQVDGEFVGTTRSVDLRSARRALTVVA